MPFMGLSTSHAAVESMDYIWSQNHWVLSSFTLTFGLSESLSSCLTLSPFLLHCSHTQLQELAWLSLCNVESGTLITGHF